MENNRNDIQRYHGNYDNNDDEIDLYELVEILVKNRMTVIVTAVTITLGSMGAAFKVNQNYKKAELTRIESIPGKETAVSEAKTELEKREVKLREAINFESEKYSSAEGVAPLIQLKYSDLIREVKESEGKYKEANQALTASKTPGKSKGMLILAVGIVLGIFLGIFLAFIQEFIEGYRKREKK